MYETRLTLNYVFGTLTNAAAVSDTTLVSADFVPLPAGLSTTTYVPITLQDPATKVFEVVWATGHGSGASTVTVVRAREGGSARSWPVGTLWTVAPTLRDGVLPVANRAALPTDPHGGLRAYLQDEQLILEWIVGVGWVNTVAGVGYRATQVLAADTGTVNFTNIPSTLKKVTVNWTARCTSASMYDTLCARVNGVASGYYTSVFNQIGTNGAYTLEYGATYANSGYMGGTPAAAANWGAGEVTFLSWNAPGGRTAMNHLARSHFVNSATDIVNSFTAGQVNTAPPYTSLLFLPATGVFKAGTEFTLYGYM